MIHNVLSATLHITNNKQNPRLIKPLRSFKWTWVSPETLYTGLSMESLHLRVTYIIFANHHHLLPLSNHHDSMKLSVNHKPLLMPSKTILMKNGLLYD